MNVYTIYDGIIEKHDVIRKTPQGYRVLHNSYKTGRQISGSKVNLGDTCCHSRVNYVTEDINEALYCSNQYYLKIQEHLSKISICINEFSN